MLLTQRRPVSAASCSGRRDRICKPRLSIGGSYLNPVLDLELKQYEAKICNLEQENKYLRKYIDSLKSNRLSFVLSSYQSEVNRIEDSLAKRNASIERQNEEIDSIRLYEPKKLPISTQIGRSMHLYELNVEKYSKKQKQVEALSAKLRLSHDHRRLVEVKSMIQQIRSGKPFADSKSIQFEVSRNRDKISRLRASIKREIDRITFLSSKPSKETLAAIKIQSAARGYLQRFHKGFDNSSLFSTTNPKSYATPN